MGRVRLQAGDHGQAREDIHRWAWIGLLGGSSIAFSLIFACAAPFAALVALAALNMNRRDALIVSGPAWTANQAVGCGLLGYPHTPNSYAWGLAIGIAVLLALLSAQSIGARLPVAAPLSPRRLRSLRLLSPMN